MPKKTAFLAAFAISGQVSKAAKAVGMERGIHWRWLRDDASYPAAFEAAKEEAAQLLEDEAVRRAHLGVQEPIIFKGSYCYQVTGTDPETGELTYSDKPMVIRKYSDSLMMFLLKGMRPEKYKDRVAAEVTHKFDIAARLAKGRERNAKRAIAER